MTQAQEALRKLAVIAEPTHQHSNASGAVAHQAIQILVAALERLEKGSAEESAQATDRGRPS